jgi:hypothetical protein
MSSKWYLSFRFPHRNPARNMRRPSYPRYDQKTSVSTALQNGRSRIRFPVGSLDIFSPHSVALWFHSASNINKCLGTSLGATCNQRVELTTLPNVKGRMEAQHSIPSLSLHQLLRESFTLTMRNTIFLISGLIN